MKRRFLFLIGIFLSVKSLAQLNAGVKLMSWNVLNWPSTSNYIADTTQRCPAYRAVINYAQPDILITSENTSVNSVPVFLNQVMNTGTYHYKAGTFINGYDTDNGIYYRDSLFDFISNQPIQTSLRDISHFTLVYKQTGDTIHVFSCHLKAGQGYEPQRAAEIAKLRLVTNAFPAGTNFLIGGDFNIYAESEPAYTGMLQDNTNDDGNFLDVLQLSGTWNFYGYAPYHTQSTHYNSTGTFSGGGMDDRFDMILFSNAVSQPGGVYYLPGSYKNIGNDGNHFNRDINYGTNSNVPSTVANALYDASDHLPIMVTLMFGTVSGVDDIQNNLTEIRVFPNPVTEESKVSITLKEKGDVDILISDALGRSIFKSQTLNYGPGQYLLPFDFNKLENPGFYLLSIKIDNYLISKKIIVIK